MASKGPFQPKLWFYKDIDRECINTVQTRIVSEGCNQQRSGKFHFRECFINGKALQENLLHPHFQAI